MPTWIFNPIQITNSKKESAASISIGNTGTEALSAYLATTLNPVKSNTANKLRLEEQLENLLLQTDLENRELDLGPRFKAARHAKGFTPENGGSLWEVRPAADNTDKAPAHITLPLAMAAALDALNTKQQQLDRAKTELQHEKHILFADWYKYMLCAYPPDDARDTYPDIDLARYYIETKQLPKIQQASTQITTLTSESDAAKQALSVQLNNFNTSLILNKILLSKALNKDISDTSGLTIHNKSWVTNEPFSSHCLDFNGSGAYIEIPSLTRVRAISLW